jgi:hypothetical protein
VNTELELELELDRELEDEELLELMYSHPSLTIKLSKSTEKVSESPFGLNQTEMTTLISSPTHSVLSLNVFPFASVHHQLLCELFQK